MTPAAFLVIVVAASVAASFLPRGAVALRVIAALALFFVGPWHNCHRYDDGVYRCSNSLDHILPNLPYRALAAGAAVFLAMGLFFDVVARRSADTR